MIEIELPCCETPVRVDSLDDLIRCDACGIEHEVAADEPALVALAA
jgi:hypothetical protein